MSCTYCLVCNEGLNFMRVNRQSPSRVTLFFSLFVRSTMSRLIVKNLPSYLTPDGLRKHFAQNGAPPGTITDIKISHKPDGTSRRFGFVGFKTDKEAAAARDWFDKTCVDSTRISVAVVEGVSCPPQPFPFLSLVYY